MSTIDGPRARSRARSVRWGAMLLAGAVLVSSARAEEGYEFTIADTEAAPGEDLELLVEGRYARAAQGFSMAGRYPPGALTDLAFDPTDTILDALDVDWFEAAADPMSGAFTVGCLVDAEPPFDGAVLPAIGRPLALFRLRAKVAPDQDVDVEVRLEDGVQLPGGPPIDNLYSVDDRPVPVERLARATVRLPGPPEPVFLRGDVTLDLAYDISDAIAILDWAFQGGPEPECLDAADANDDRTVDVSDAIRILGYLFAGHAAPPPPSLAPGPDPTEDELGCTRSLASG